jgi:hypothetical protein
LAFCPIRAVLRLLYIQASENKELGKEHLVGCEMYHDGLAFIANSTITSCDQKIVYK